MIASSQWDSQSNSEPGRNFYESFALICSLGCIKKGEIWGKELPADMQTGSNGMCSSAYVIVPTYLPVKEIIFQWHFF